MDSSWISLNLQMADIPYFDPKKKTIIEPKGDDNPLKKFSKKH
jgi:hypothetical protein